MLRMAQRIKAISLKPKVINRYIKPVIHLLALLPFTYLVYGFYKDTLGFNPVELMTHETGIWALRFLLISLFISPLRTLTQQNWLIHFRRMLGLYAFFYALCHFMVYFVFDQGLTLSYVLEDLLLRPYISVGFAALLILFSLACTSTNGIRRRMKRHWNRLHKGVYLAAIGVMLHFFWLTKADYTEPLIYLGIFVFLMAFRLKDLAKK